MELGHYLMVLRRSSLFITFVTLVFIVLAAAFALTAKPTYDSSLSITVSRTEAVAQKDASYYLYDGYYNAQASGLYADTLANWLQTPNIVEAIYTRAGQTLPKSKSISALAKLFSVRKMPPSTLSITVTNLDQNAGSSLLEAAVKELKSRNREVALNNKDGQYALDATSSTTVKTTPSLSLAIGLALILGLITSTFVVFVRQLLRQS